MRGRIKFVEITVFRKKVARFHKVDRNSIKMCLQFQFLHQLASH